MAQENYMGLMYFGKHYDRFVKEHDLDIYSKRLLKIPTPKYYVLYNGDTETEDVVLLKLSDSFIHPVNSGEFEWTAIMININYGHNEKILNACQVLKEYAIFVAKVKMHRSNGVEIEEAVTNAVDECIKEDILSDYFKTHKAEVIDVCITEYDEVETLLASRKEAEIDGFIRALKSTGKTKEEIVEYVCKEYGLTRNQSAYYYDTLPLNIA